MPKGTVTCNNFLALLYNATAWANVADNAASSPLTSIYMALATASYTGGSNQSSNETAYTNYTRKATSRTTGGWTAPSGGSTSNAAAVEFDQCGVTGATITSASTGKAVSGAGDIYHAGDLNSPIIVSDQIQPRFAIGTITITET